MLLFASLLPNTISLVSDNFNNATVQVFCGVSIIISLLNIVISMNLGKNKPSTHCQLLCPTPNCAVYFDIGLKIVELILTITVYPPLMIIAIFLVSAMLMIGFTQV